MDSHEAARIFPVMTGQDYIGLRDNIKEHGLLEPIILYDGKILDGRNRYTACLDLGIDPVYEEYTGEQTPLDYVLSKNLHRRHLNETQRGIIASKIANMPKYIHKTDRQICLSQPDAAEILNVSERTVRSIKAIERDAPDLLPKMESGELTVNKAITEMKRREVIANLEDIAIKESKVLEGVYDVIVIDPPWPMEKIERDVAPNQVAFEYPTMSFEELRNLDIPTAEDCHVWLWTTHKFIEWAFELLTYWEMNYICTFVWHKPGGFQPFGLPQYNCEFALYAHFGNPKFIDFKDFKVCFDAQRGAHSEKPELFYDVVRRVTAGRRLDMFSRRNIEGFDGWGKEAK